MKIRILNAAGQSLRAKTAHGDYTVQIVSTRHGWSDTAVTTYCIAATPQINGRSCPISPPRSSRQQAVADWNDGFEIPEPSSADSTHRSMIVNALIAGGTAEYIGA